MSIFRQKRRPGWSQIECEGVQRLTPDWEFLRANGLLVRRDEKNDITWIIDEHYNLGVALIKNRRLAEQTDRWRRGKF